MNRIITTILAAVILTGTAAAYASGEHSNLIPPGAPKGYLDINPVTCRFLHPEIDVTPSATERYARAEDSRDDVHFQCLNHRLGKVGLGRPGARGPRGLTGPTGPTGPAGPAGPAANKGLGVCLDNHPDSRGFRDIRVCNAGDAGFIGYLVN